MTRNRVLALCAQTCEAGVYACAACQRATGPLALSLVTFPLGSVVDRAPLAGGRALASRRVKDLATDYQRMGGRTFNEPTAAQ